MKKGLDLLKLWVILALCSCNTYPPPKIERCITGWEKWACYDGRIDKEYFLTPQENYISTNPDDYRIISDYVNDLREELQKCELR